MNDTANTFNIVVIEENTYNPIDNDNALLFAACVLLYILYRVVVYQRTERYK